VTDFTAADWALAALASLGIGLSKAGLPGIGLLHVLIMAKILPAKASTGVVLPMLIFADFFAVGLYRTHARWKDVLAPLGPAVVGIALGAWLMPRIPDLSFAPVIGWIVLTLCVLQFARRLWPDRFEHVPHSAAFSWAMGITSGIATMLANAAGPIMALYLLARGLPRWAFVGTAALFFCIVNLIKVPFSVGLGLINAPSLALNLWLLPGVVLGLFLGRWIVARIPQKAFEDVVLALCSLVAVRMIWS
jgi:uncharacterized membrane protein YfcA